MKLELLDHGTNKLNGTFPSLLESLPMLQDLILRSNKFHGSVVIFSFTKLGILDLSDNELSGNLPVRYFENFKAMRA